MLFGASKDNVVFVAAAASAAATATGSLDNFSVTTTGHLRQISLSGRLYGFHADGDLLGKVIALKSYPNCPYSCVLVQAMLLLPLPLLLC